MEYPPPYLDHSSVYQEGVTFSETEEKCSRSSPLTLTRVLKAPLQGEEVKRTRKRKRVASELQREAALRVEEKLENIIFAKNIAEKRE